MNDKANLMAAKKEFCAALNEKGLDKAAMAVNGTIDRIAQMAETVPERNPNTLFAGCAKTLMGGAQKLRNCPGITNGRATYLDQVGAVVFDGLIELDRKAVEWLK